MRKLILIFLIVLCDIGVAQMSNTQQQQVPYINILENGGFEGGLAGFEVDSPGTKSAVAAGGFGSALIWTASATGEFAKTRLVVIPEILWGKKCVATVRYNSTTITAGDVIARVTDGTNVIHEDRLLAPTPADGKWGTEELGFICPSSGSLQIEYESTAAAVVKFDNNWLGSDYRTGETAPIVTEWQTCDSILTNIVIGSGAQTCKFKRLGSDMTFKYTFSDNTWDSSGSFEISPPNGLTIDNSQIPDTTVINYMGSATAYDVSLNQYVLGNLRTNTPAGNFLYLSGADGQTSVWGGTGSRPFDWLNGDDVLTIEGTVPILEWANTGTTQTVTTENQDWFVDAEIGGGNIAQETGSTTVWATFSNNGLDLVKTAGSDPVGIACDLTNDNDVGDLTCSSGGETNAIIFNAPRAMRVEACSSFTHQNQGMNVYYQLAETASNSQTILQEGVGKIGSGSNNVANDQHTVKVCGTFTLDAGKTTLRLFSMATSNGGFVQNTVLADRNSSNGYRNIHWTVTPINSGSATVAIQPASATVAGGVTYGTTEATCTIDQDVCGGTYTPSVTNINCTSVSNSNVFQYMKIGPVVSVSGKITAANCDPGDSFRFAAPIAPLASFLADSEASGQATWNANDANNTGTCKSAASTSDLAAQRRSSTTGNSDVFVNCLYRLD